MDERCSLIVQKSHNASYLFKILEFFMDSKSSQFSRERQNPIKNFNSIGSRWVVETAVKIWEISGRNFLGVIKDG